MTSRDEGRPNDPWADAENILLVAERSLRDERTSKKNEINTKIILN